MLNIPGLTFDTFNVSGREINIKCDIYFDGLANAPVTISHNDYVIDSSILEEAYSNNGPNPIGESSANEIDITLYDKEGVFNPANSQSIYAAKIKKGLILKVHLSCNNSPYAPMGVFGVTDWQYKVDTSTVIILGYDTSYFIKKDDTFYLRSFTNMYLAVFVQYMLEEVNRRSSIVYDLRLNTMPNKFLLCAYLSSNNLGSSITDLGTSLASNIYMDRYAKFMFDNFFNFEPNINLYKELTDDNQIYSVSIKQDIIALPNSINVSYSAFASEVLEVYSSETPASFSSSLILEIDTDNTILTVDSIILSNSDCKATSIIYAKHLTITLTGTHFDSIKINARVVKDNNTSSVTIKTGDIDTDTLNISGSLIQNKEDAQEYANKLLTYANTQVQIIEVSAKGNPVIEIGDCIKINSTHSNITLYGKVIRAKYDYTGGLKCVYTLVNIQALGGTINE